jgi:small subunit ribosomal protein S15
MALSSSVTAEVINEYKRGDKDTGSSEVQIALLTTRIQGLTEHLKLYNKDNHSRRGLMKLVSQRRKLLDYLKRISIERYKTLIERLNIRR